MNMQVLNAGSLSYAVIDDMYSPQEIYAAKKEIEFLQIVKQGPSETQSALNDDGSYLKSGGGIFIDDFYTDRSSSVLLTLNRRIFNQDLVEHLVSKNYFYRHIATSNFDSTLINFYDDSEQYKVHHDRSIFTALTFFKIGTFSGGNFCFPAHGVVIEPVEGRTVLFPGCVPHQANPICAAPNNYRVTMAQFINYMPNLQKSGVKNG